MVKKIDYKNLSMKEKYEMYNINKIGYLDIEATNLKANFGYMLSWAMVVRDVRTGKTELRYDCMNLKDKRNAAKHRRVIEDKRILESLMKNLKDVDLLVGHYFHGWGKMDIPFIRTRCIFNKTSGFPKHRQIRYGDTWRMAHQCYSLNSYRLETVADMMGIKTKKTPVTALDWQLAQSGDPKSLKYVLTHNIKDAKINYEVHKMVEAYVTIPNAYI